MGVDGCTSTMGRGIELHPQFISEGTELSISLNCHRSPTLGSLRQVPMTPGWLAPCCILVVGRNFGAPSDTATRLPSALRPSALCDQPCTSPTGFAAEHTPVLLRSESSHARIAEGDENPNSGQRHAHICNISFAVQRQYQWFADRSLFVFTLDDEIFKLVKPVFPPMSNFLCVYLDQNLQRTASRSNSAFNSHYDILRVRNLQCARAEFQRAPLGTEPAVAHHRMLHIATDQ